MNPSAITAFFSPELVRALGWTLLHSLWQGALIALALAVLLVLLHRHSAQVRYVLSGSALLLLLAAAALTFVSYYAAPTAGTLAAAPEETAFLPSPPAALQATEAAEASGTYLPAITSTLGYYFEAHLPLKTQSPRSRHRKRKPFSGYSISVCKTRMGGTRI